MNQQIPSHLPSLPPKRHNQIYYTRGTDNKQHWQQIHKHRTHQFPIRSISVVHDPIWFSSTAIYWFQMDQFEFELFFSRFHITAGKRHQFSVRWNSLLLLFEFLLNSWGKRKLSWIFVEALHQPHPLQKELNYINTKAPTTGKKNERARQIYRT